MTEVGACEIRLTLNRLVLFRSQNSPCAGMCFNCCHWTLLPSNTSRAHCRFWWRISWNKKKKHDAKKPTIKYAFACIWSNFTNKTDTDNKSKCRKKPYSLQSQKCRPPHTPVTHKSVSIPTPCLRKIASGCHFKLSFIKTPVIQHRSKAPFPSGLGIRMKMDSQQGWHGFFWAQRLSTL